MLVLPPRQSQVAELVARGLSNKEIASALDIAEQTVKNHVHEIYVRFQVTNRVQLTIKIRALTIEQAPRVA